MLFVNNKTRLFTIRERIDKQVIKCDLIPGDNEITKPEVISMLKGSFYFKELVKNGVMSIGRKEEEKTNSTNKKKKKKS